MKPKSIWLPSPLYRCLPMPKQEARMKNNLFPCHPFSTQPPASCGCGSLEARDGVLHTFCTLSSTDFLVGCAQVSAQFLSMDLLRVLLFLFPFRLGHQGKWHRAPIPLSIATLGQPALEQMRGASGTQELERLYDERSDHLLAFGMNHMDFLSIFATLFSMKTHIHTLNPAQRTISRWRKSMKMCVVPEQIPEGWALVTERAKGLHSESGLVPALWSCKPSEPLCILHRVAVRMKWDFMCSKRNWPLFHSGQGPPAQSSQIFSSCLHPTLLASVAPSLNTHTGLHSWRNAGHSDYLHSHCSLFSECLFLLHLLGQRLLTHPSIQQMDVYWVSTVCQSLWQALGTQWRTKQRHLLSSWSLHFLNNLTLSLSMTVFRDIQPLLADLSTPSFVPHRCPNFSIIMSLTLTCSAPTLLSFPSPSAFLSSFLLPSLPPTGSHLLCPSSEFMRPIPEMRGWLLSDR